METILFNRCQTPIEDLNLQSYPKEVIEQFFDFINNVPFIKWMVSLDRPLISELPRDDEGRAIIDVTHPPILEDTDYFRKTALTWQEIGKYTHLRPNKNPNSDFGRWLSEERRRSWEGYLNPDTGMWVTGDYYWMLNYCPMHLVVKRKDGLEMRATRHPKFWDGQFLISHYLLQSRIKGHHSAYLASRGRGKTSFAAAMLAKRFVLGESMENQKEVQCLVTAADRTKLMGTNQILDVFVDYIDFCAKNTYFPSRRLKSSLQEMYWEMGWKNSGSEVALGSKNSVSGIISGVNQDKLNGSRGVLYLVEEAGIFKNLREMYNMIRPSVEQGASVFGQIALYGTAGDNQSNFAAFSEMFYSPEGYNLNSLPNVFDKEGQGRKNSCMFYPAYMNYDDSCIDENGNSDVTKALLKLCYDRYKVKYGTTDINTLTRRISQYPITPQEAIIRSHGNIFPVTELNERLNQIDNNPGEYDEVYVGELVQEGSEVKFVPTTDLPIRDFPTKDNKAHPYSERVYTPSGIKTWGEIKVGDKLFGTDGNTVNVIDIPFDDVTDVYEITLKDGRKVRASGNHKWEIITTNGYHKLLSTKEMFDNKWYRICKEYKKRGYRNLKYFIPKNEGANYAKRELPIMPYFLGLMLGDGCICRSTKNRVKFTASIDDMEEYKKRFSYYVNTIDDRHHYIYVDGIKEAFAELGLSEVRSGTKFIPDVYKFCAREDRLELLRGLLDTDGTIDYGGNVSYSTVSEQLAQDVLELARSLGINCNVRNSYIASSGSKVTNLLFYTEERLFNLERKYKRQEITKNRYKKTGIYDIKYIGKDRCKCVTVDAKDSCYLIGDYVTTHNCKGAIEIFEMPKKDPQGKIPSERYILSCDPFDTDVANTMSLGSCFVLDLWTDRIVAEYTGRPMFADDLYEIVRKLCLFYNGKCMYEANIKGCFGYFSAHNCTHLLADTPEYLKDKQLITSIGYGNQAKGIRATVPIIKYGFRLIRDWLLKSITKIEKDTEGKEVEVNMPNLYNIRNRALLKELIQWNPVDNFDRTMSLVQLMLYREEKMIIFQGNVRAKNTPSSGMEKDDYWEKNYPGKPSERYGSNVYNWQ